MKKLLAASLLLLSTAVIADDDDGGGRGGGGSGTKSHPSANAIIEFSQMCAWFEIDNNPRTNCERYGPPRGIVEVGMEKDPYQLKLREAMKDNLEYPFRLTHEWRRGISVIEMTLDENGNLLSSKVIPNETFDPTGGYKKWKNDYLIDEVALRIVNKAKFYPKPPVEFKTEQNTYVVLVPLNFKFSNYN
jgi:hypothetical protein